MRRFLLLLSVLLLVNCRAMSQPVPTTIPPTTIPPTPTPSPQELVGRPLKATSAAVYLLTQDGLLRHIYDWPTFLALGLNPGDVVTVEPESLARYPLGAPLTRWVFNVDDAALYYLQRGVYYPITDAAVLAATGGSVQDVSLIDNTILHTLTSATGTLEGLERVQAQPPHITAAAWLDDALWVADESGHLAAWDGTAWQEITHPFGADAAITALIMANGAHFAGVSGSGLWRWMDDINSAERIADYGDITAMTAQEGGAEWLADGEGYHDGDFYTGAGIVAVLPNENGFTAFGDVQALRHATTLIQDSNYLWVGTDGGGLWRYRWTSQAWEQFDTLNSPLRDNSIRDMAQDADGWLWLALPSGVGRWRDGQFEMVFDNQGISARGMLALAIMSDNEVWASGENFISHRKPDDTWETFSAFDTPILLDTFSRIVAHNEQVWFTGTERVVHYDGVSWTAIDNQSGEVTTFAPDESAISTASAFPDPTSDYDAWLAAWPRPAGDNGMCLHYLQSPAGDSFEVWQNLSRLERLHMRWTLVNYTERGQLLQIAPIFDAAGVMTVWRPFVRPYQHYDYWAEDVAFLRSMGIAPYIQVYNEPSLGQEWDGQPIDQEVYLRNLLPAMREVYDAGGYVGLQNIDPEWLRTVLQRMKAEGMDDVFSRLFFVPHPYGFNHPPEYDDDINSVLGFRDFATIFTEAIDFVPPMIAGEGGWRPGEAQDNRYPAVSEELHCDYHLAVFDWFRSGTLSNGVPLPDYLFAFCPWLISDPFDAAAWFDSAAGNRTLTIEAVAALPEFERR